MEFNLKAYIALRRKVVNDHLRKVLRLGRGAGSKALRAMRYSVFAGGKRLRPTLVLAGAEMLRGRWRSFLPAACAVELVHTYSLIHDDLPAMDNDDWRRGVPTCHRRYDEATAILAGDALNTMAFELLASQAGKGGVSAQQVVEAMRELARAAGPGGMVGGQVLDLAAEKKNISLARLRELHLKKTGALIAASLRIGGILAGANSREVGRLGRYGRHIGLAFQIADDLLDATCSRKSTGKDTGSDRRQGKSTFVSHFGVEGARRHAAQEVKLARRVLKPFGNRAMPLDAIADYIIARKN